MRIAWGAVLLAGCAVPPAAPGPGADAYRAAMEQAEAPFRVPGTITAQLNEEVQVGGVRVKPLEVVEDSRCPIDATCVWAGRVRLRVAVNGVERVIELDRPVIVAGGVHLILAAVAPPSRALPPPAGMDPNAPKRFAFRLSVVD